MGNIYSINKTPYSPHYYGDDSEGVFKTNYRQVDNIGWIEEPQFIIIFEGGDVYGYEENTENNI